MWTWIFLMARRKTLHRWNIGSYGTVPYNIERTCSPIGWFEEISLHMYPEYMVCKLLANSNYPCLSLLYTRFLTTIVTIADGSFLLGIQERSSHLFPTVSGTPMRLFPVKKHLGSKKTTNIPNLSVVSTGIGMSGWNSITRLLSMVNQSLQVSGLFLLGELIQLTKFHGHPT